MWLHPYDIYDSEGVVQEQKPICKALFETQVMTTVINNGIKFGIIGVNVMIRMAVIWIITAIGCSTESH